MDVRDEIKSRLSIDQVVGRYVELKRAGASYRGLCPFHQEKTPSFYVTPSRGTFHCFGCGRGGDQFTFIMEMERIPFPDALKKLAEQAGVTLPERESRAPSLKGRLHEANEAAAQIFGRLLREKPGERARLYLESRDFGDDAMDLFGLGYAPQARDMVVQQLRKEGFDDRIILSAGLAVQDDVGGTPRDRFRGRLMFPIRDAGGKISGFGGRALEEGQQPKYLNSPQTELFDKSSVLYGIHLAGDPIRKAGRAVLVEGYLDAVRAHGSGFRETVASLGTAVTTQQLGTLTRWTTKVVLALDPDPAGQSAAARTALNALAEVTRSRGRAQGGAGALDLFIARLPDARDPDELIQADPSAWERAIEDAIPAFDFFFDTTLANLDRSTDGWRQEAIDRLVPVIQQFAESTGWVSKWMERVARETGVPSTVLERSLPSAGSRRRREPQRRQDAPQQQSVVNQTTSRGLTEDPVTTFEEGLLAMLLRVVIVPDDACSQLQQITFRRQTDRAVLEALLRWRSTGNYDVEMFLETLSPELQEHVRHMLAREVPLPEDGKVSVAVAFHLARIERYRLLSELDRARTFLPEVPPEDQSAAMARVARLYEESRELEKRLDALSLAVARPSSRSAPNSPTA